MSAGDLAKTPVAGGSTKFPTVFPSTGLFSKSVMYSESVKGDKQCHNGKQSHEDGMSLDNECVPFDPQYSQRQ